MLSTCGLKVNDSIDNAIRMQVSHVLVLVPFRYAGSIVECRPFQNIEVHVPLQMTTELPSFSK
jgi:hypothetical protein